MDLIIVIGAFGSGKSEYAINLAKTRHELGESVVLIDMDIVNPYFRSRDVRENFAAQGIEVVCPQGEYAFADVPALSPRIQAAIHETGKTVILDVGGDPSGCRVLSRFRDDVRSRDYQMRFVVNTRRPFTSDQEGIRAMQRMLEQVSGLKVTHFICNTNLMELTTADIVREGLEIVEQAAIQENVSFNEYLVLQDHAEAVPDHLAGKNRVVLRHYLVKPWETGELHIRGI